MENQPWIDCNFTNNVLEHDRGTEARLLGKGSVHEDVEETNPSRDPVKLSLTRVQRRHEIVYPCRRIQRVDSSKDTPRRKRCALPSWEVSLELAEHVEK